MTLAEELQELAKDPDLTAQLLRTIARRTLISVREIDPAEVGVKTTHTSACPIGRPRHHQGLENRLIDGARWPAARHGPVRRRERLGGSLNYYYREAA